MIPNIETNKLGLYYQQYLWTHKPLENLLERHLLGNTASLMSHLYVALHNEIEIFEVDYQNDIPILLK